MFDHTIQSLSTRDAKREAIEGAILKAQEAGTLTYTDIMLNERELVTFAFEILDGVRTSSDNIPQYDASERIDIGPVRLVAIDPSYDIRLPKWVYERIPGTNAKPRNRTKVNVSLGNMTVLDDRYDEGRPARQLLWEHGWPQFQFRSRSGQIGTIVEWKWFERVATGADATAEYKNLYKDLKARVDGDNVSKDKTKPTAQFKQASL